MGMKTLTPVLSQGNEFALRDPSEVLTYPKWSAEPLALALLLQHSYRIKTALLRAKIRMLPDHGELIASIDFGKFTRFTIDRITNRRQFSHQKIKRTL